MRIIVLNLCLGISLVCLGFEQQGYGLLMSWLGVSFIFLGLAYSGLLSSNLYNKNELGKIPIFFIILHLPFFIYLWSLWHLIQWLIKESAYHQINENIIIGRRLLKHECPQAIVNYLDLTVEFNEAQVLVEAHNYIFLPILDGHVPDIEQLENSFDKLAEGLTYIHCAQGHGRTGLYTALLLAKQGSISSVEEALTLLQKNRPALNINKKQKTFLQNYLNQIKSDQ